jgi:hypothetical protein
LKWSLHLQSFKLTNIICIFYKLLCLFNLHVKCLTIFYLIIKNSLKTIQDSSLEFAFFVHQSLQLCNFKQMFQKYILVTTLIFLVDLLKQLSLRHLLNGFLQRRFLILIDNVRS